MRLFAPLLLLVAASCAGPRPCTRALCVDKLDGTLEVSGWSGTRRDTADSPKPPVLSDSEVRVVFGRAEFVNGTTRVAAEEGSSFAFSVSTRALATLSVSSGTVVVTPAGGSATPVAPGSSLVLPKAK